MLYIHKQLFSLVLLLSLPALAMQKEDLVWEKDANGKLTRPQKNSNNDDVIKELKWLFDQKEAKWTATEQESVSHSITQDELPINPMTQTICVISKFKTSQLKKAELLEQKTKLAEQEKKQQEEIEKQKALLAEQEKRQQEETANSMIELIRRRGIKEAARDGATYCIVRNKEEIKKLEQDNVKFELLSKEYEKEFAALNKTIDALKSKEEIQKVVEDAPKKKSWFGW